VNFCRFWGMTPRQVEQLTVEEHGAMFDYAVREQRAQRRAARAARKGRG